MLTKKLLALATMSCAFALVGCQSNATNCAGWKAPPPLNNPAAYVKNERRHAEWSAATDQYGKKQGCWK